MTVARSKRSHFALSSTVIVAERVLTDRFGIH